MIALSARPLRLATVSLAAALLAACGGQQTTQQPRSQHDPVPVSPVLGDVPLGSPDAPVTMIEYAALTCHVCRDFAKQVLPRLKREYIDTGKLRYIYRDYPLESDAVTGKAGGFGLILSSVARCKGPDKYHELLDGLFAAQGDLLDAARTGTVGPILAGVATQHGMTEPEMYTCIDHQPELKAAIQKSRDEGAEKGVRGTPGIFLSTDLEITSDEMLVNTVPNWENISAAIEAKLAGKPLPTPGAPADASAVSTPATTTTTEPAPASTPATPPAQ